MKLEIEYLPIGELTPYSGNAKKHPAEQIEQIKRSIEEFGFNDPIAVWGEKNIIVEGHGRLIAAQEMGIEAVPIIRLDELTDTQRRAYTLAHNKLTMNSDFNLDILQMELEDLSDIDMKEFGFDIAAFDVSDETDDEKEKTWQENISVVVECEDENAAQELYDRLTNEGYTCKVSTL